MIMTETMIYWITRLDGIRGFCCGIQTIAVLFAVLGIIAAIVALCISIAAEEEGSDDDARIASSICKIACKVWIPAFCIAIVCSLARTFTPTTKEMIAIKVIPQMASVDNVEKIKDVSKDMLGITAEWLKDMRKKYVAEHDK